ncbi:hypothetical protein BS78_06G288600, partial [Paspalum vaginatum]
MPPPPSCVGLPCLAFNRDKCSDAPILFSLWERTAVPTWATPQGWFLVRHHAQIQMATFLWNPSNGDKIQLPPLQHDAPRMSPVMWYCHVGGGGDGSCWTRHEYDIGTQMLDAHNTEKLVITPVASCQGKIYFTNSFEELGVIDFCPEPVFSSIAMREVVTGGYGIAHKAKVLMVESEEQLHMVILLFDGSYSDLIYEVSVYRMDFSAQQWRRLHDLGGRAFLVAFGNFCASCPADECGLERDCVYIPYPWEQSLFIYNVRERTMKEKKLEQAPESM